MFEKDVATEIITKSPLSIEREGEQKEIVPEEGTNGNTREPASTTELQAQEHRDVKEIAAAIISRKETIVRSFLEIGNLLLDAKEQLTKHGGWMNWLDNEVNIGRTLYAVGEGLCKFDIGDEFGNDESSCIAGPARGSAGNIYQRTTRGKWTTENRQQYVRP